MTVTGILAWAPPATFVAGMSVMTAWAAWPVARDVLGDATRALRGTCDRHRAPVDGAGTHGGERIVVCGRWGTDGCDRQGCAILGRCADLDAPGRAR